LNAGTLVRLDKAEPDVPKEEVARGVRWSCGIVLVATLVLVLAMLRRTHGHFTYLLDDPAIHLAVARDLALHGTWGVSPHDYQSASSSPLWTLLLAPFALLPRPVFEVVPLILNVAAALWIARLLVVRTGLLRPAWGRWLDVAAMFVVLVGVLFLPGLAAVGMEHTLHIAFLLQALVWLQDWLDGVDGRAWRRAVLMLGLAAATRFETPFVAAGIGVGLLLLCVPRLRPSPRPRLLRQTQRAVVLGLVSLIPLACYAVVNLAMGQDALPNSVVAKSALGGGTSGIRITLVGTVEALAKDPVVLVGFVLALTYCLAAFYGGPRRYLVLATTLVVTAVLHSALASYGWYERYQAYLVAIVVLFVLLAARECVPVRFIKAAPAVIAVAGALLVPVKWDLLRQAPLAADNTYLQRYQAALFVERYYKGLPIATGEVGYIALYHDGPLLDVLGLASHEVLSARRDHRATAAFWADIVKRAGARLIVVYPLSIFFDTPAQWILVGELTLHEKTLSAFEPALQFWAPAVGDVARIHAQLLAFRARLPPGATIDINKDINKDVSRHTAG